MKNLLENKKIKYSLQCLLFFVIVGIILKIYYRVIVPKYFTDEIYSVTTTQQGFYDMDHNTVDVLFLGPSSATNAFLPQELYNQYGIRSYNLSCEDQSLLTSYYWLREALKHQSPSVVVLEASKLFDDFEAGPLVSETYLTAKAFEGMHWSPLKLRAIYDICTIDPDEKMTAYIFPNIRYHERDDISAKDFSYRKMSSWSELKGYTFIPLKSEYEFDGWELGYDSAADQGAVSETFREYADFNPLMEKYLDKIVEICDKNGIRLVLAYAPSLRSSTKTCNALEKYASNNGLKTINFNDKKVFKAAGYDFSEMNSDKAHSNIWGAVCITDYVGKVLSESYKIPVILDTQWETTKEFFDFTLTQAKLIYMTDADEYLKVISDERYSVTEDQGIGDIFHTRYTVSEERTGRLVDIGIISKGEKGETLTHEEVDIN